jgi:competence protein ComEC
VHPFPPRVSERVLEVTALDVGQGDSLLVAFPDRRVMVIDGGGIPSFGGRAPRTQLDIGEDVVAPYLWSRSVRRVDVLVMSHAHDDHIGGLPALLDAFHPRELWTGAAPDSPKWLALRDRARAHGVRVVPLTGPHRFTFGGVQVDVLAPPDDYQVSPLARNDDSLVLRAAFGRHAFLLTGDVERQMEYRMVDGGGLSRSDVLKVAHHGSRTSTTEEFLQVVHPAFALISSGAGNSYGHPHPSVVERLERSGVLVLRTDREGQVCVRSDGVHLEIETNRWRGQGAPGLLSVFQ